MKKTTRNDVAAEAGVSSATVSRVYNNPESVSPEKREAVLSASGKLGYFPDKAASALRRNGTGIIVLADIKKSKDSYSWNSYPVFKWFYSDVIEGIQKVINSSMYQLNIESFDSPDKLSSLKDRCDGIIVFDAEDIKTAQAAADTGIPYILAHHTVNFKGFNTCSTDNYYGGVLQGQMLKKAGAVNPVYISGLTDRVFSHSQRLQGFKSVYPDAETADPEDIGVEAGRKAVISIKEKIHSRQIDSIAVVNDFTAAGVFYRLSDYGFKIPDDIQIVSYDNTPFNSILPLPFATVDANPSFIYEKSASLLITEVMKGRKIAETVKPSAVPGSTLRAFL